MFEIDEIIKYSHSLRLLYVEDNQDAREMTTFLLEDFFDEIIVAVDGEDALEKYNTNSIDLIITDINMPKMTGLELSKEIRKQDSEIPIIILSAHNEDSFFMESIRYGVNGYLLKPIEVEQFMNLLTSIIEKYKYKAQAEENLLLLQEYKEAANESSIVSKADPRGIITYVNQAFCDISGYTEEELIGKPHNIIRHPDNPKSLFQEIWHTIKDEKKVWKGIIKNQNKKKKSYYTDSVIMPFTNLKGEITEYISLRHDVTQIMNPAKQLNDEIKNSSTVILLYMKLYQYDILEEFYDQETLQEVQEKALEYLENKFIEKYTFDKLYPLENGEFALVIRDEKYLQNMKVFIKELKELQETIKEEKIRLSHIEYDIAILLSFAYEKERIIESVKIGIKKLLRTKKTFILANNFASIEQKKAKKNMQTISMIKHAIYDSRILSYFQPIIDNTTQEIVKYESLVRLVNEDGKVLSPFFFLETAKKSNYYLEGVKTTV